MFLFISENNKENKDFTLIFKYFTKVKVQKRKTEFVTENELKELKLRLLISFSTK
jgi:integrase/recombinase XerD